MNKYINFGSCISIGNNNVTVNGKIIKVDNCNNASVVNGKVYIDGKEYKDKELEGKEIVNVIIEGNVNKLDCRGNVTVNGDVYKGLYAEGSVTLNGSNEGCIDCGGSVTISGGVNGDIKCGGSCTVMGSHTGKINAGGSVVTR